MTLGNAAAARVRLIAVQGVPPPGRAAEQAERYGAETAVPEWRAWLVCSAYGSRDVDMIVSGT
jgi:hypothetical protein